MIEDMRLAGLSEGTQKIYVGAIRRLAKVFKQSPELLSEEQVAQYLRDLIEKDKVACGTFQVARFAIQFLYSNTLQRDWGLLKKSYVCRAPNACQKFWRRTACAACCT